MPDIFEPCGYCGEPTFPGRICCEKCVACSDIHPAFADHVCKARPNVCQQTLAKALELTGGDRAKQHGDKKRNHQNIADLWNAYFGVEAVTGYRHFTAHDVAVMMCLLKIARLKSGTHNPDNYVDLCGYAGIAAEIADGQ